MDEHVSEICQKLQRIYDFMDIHGYEAVVIGRKDNFAWITCGGSSELVTPSENGSGIIIITRQSTYLLAKAMDCGHLSDEEMPGFPALELVPLKWYEESPVGKASSMLAGKRFVTDFNMGSGTCSPEVFYDLHYPLTSQEIERYELLGKFGEDIYSQISSEIKPGMRETEVAAMFYSEYEKAGIKMACNIIGSDERIVKYRHCMATSKKIERMIMLAPALQKYGLTLPITRMVYFGDRLPADTARNYDAICQIECESLAACQPGFHFSEMLEIQKSCYAQLGYKDEWEKHAQGGITGYVINNPMKCFDPAARMKPRQSFNWYLTIDGVKVEETALTDEKQARLITVSGKWPTKEYSAQGKTYHLPQIMMK